MPLQAGYRFRTAPRFHRTFRWADRLRVSNSVDALDPKLCSRTAWRVPTDAELSLLVDAAEADQPDAETSAPPRQDGPGAEHIQIFSIPQHLRSRWRELADQLAEAPAGGSLAYEAFVRDVASFLGFKGLPLPPRCGFDVVLSPAGTSLPFGDAIAGINLGDNPTSLVLRNQDYPLVRLFLQPGDGVWLSAGGSVFHHYADEKPDLDVWLMIRALRGA